MKYNEKYTQAQCDKMHWNYMQRLYRKKVRVYFTTNGNSIGGGEWFYELVVKMREGRQYSGEQLELKMRHIDFQYKKSVEKQTGRTEYKQSKDMQKKLAIVR